MRPTTELTESARMEALAEAQRVGVSVRTRGAGRAIAIAGALGVPVERKRISSDGRLIREAGRYRMVIREGQSASRSNFSICHELGHALVDQVRSDASDCVTIRGERRWATSQAWEERFCDRLAAEMLMPEGDVRGLVGKERLAVGATFGIAREFGVSAHAALIRVVEVLQDPCVLTCWRPRDGGESGAPLRLGWVVRNAGVPSVSAHQVVAPPDALVEFWKRGGWFGHGPIGTRFLGGKAVSSEFIRIGRSAFARAYAVLRGFGLTS